MIHMPLVTCVSGRFNNTHLSVRLFALVPARACRVRSRACARATMRNRGETLASLSGGSSNYFEAIGDSPDQDRKRTVFAAVS